MSRWGSLETKQLFQLDFKALMPHAVLHGRTLCVLLDVDKNGAIDLEEFVGTWELERERLLFLVGQGHTRSYSCQLHFPPKLGHHSGSAKHERHPKPPTGSAQKEWAT